MRTSFPHLISEKCCFQQSERVYSECDVKLWCFLKNIFGLAIYIQLTLYTQYLRSDVVGQIHVPFADMTSTEDDFCLFRNSSIWTEYS